MPVVTVEEVVRGKALVRFNDLPRALHGDDPRFATPVVAWERFRTDRHRNPYLQEADWAFLLARRDGRPAGRLAVHLPEGARVGRFGLWAGADDPEVAAALVAEAVVWLQERDVPVVEGPWSLGPGEGHGLLVGGFDRPGTTGRPWAPPWEARRLLEALESVGAVSVVEESSLWRLPTSEVGPVLPAVADRAAQPGQAGPYGDARLVLDGIAAVPDLSAALRSAGLRGAWALARRARERAWRSCTVVRCTAVPEVAVAALLSAAGRAGYVDAVVPWSPDPEAPPEAVHRRYRVELRPR